MSSPTPVPISKLTELKADAISLRERLEAFDPAALVTADMAEPAPSVLSDAASRAYVDARLRQLALFVLSELGLNIAPMFESAVDAIHADVTPRLEDLDGAVAEILQGEDDDQLSEEVAGQIKNVLQLARALANRLLQVSKTLDNVTRQRIAKEVNTFKLQETAIRELIDAITLEDEDADPSDAPAEGEDLEAAAPDDAAGDEPDADPVSAGEGG